MPTTPNPLNIIIHVPSHLVDQARLYAPSRDATDAVCHLLSDYPRLVADVRQMRSRLADIDRESGDLDRLISDLQHIARRVLDL